MSTEQNHRVIHIELNKEDYESLAAAYTMQQEKHESDVIELERKFYLITELTVKAENKVKELEEKNAKLESFVNRFDKVCDAIAVKFPEIAYDLQKLKS